MKLLKGYVENRTKEAALAAMMLALFFVTRSFKIQLIPGIFLLDLSGVFIYTAAAILSWHYTIIFSLATIYAGSNILVGLAWFLGCQITFFLSKYLSVKKIPFVMMFAEFLVFPFYGLLLHFGGLMKFNIYIIIAILPQAIFMLTVFFGLFLVLGVLTGLGVIEKD